MSSHFSPWIDGSIVGIYLLLTMWAGIYVRKYVTRVEDFLVAGREMNLYLGIASLAATEFGIITCMYTAQAGYNHGLAGATPGICQALSMFIVGMTGFCVKPLRESGAMTLPELFEIRFGKFVRWLAGVVIVMGGLLNMGVFLKIGGEFLCLVCGFDIRYLALMMGILLALVVVYTVLGGMLSVLVTDFLQFIVMSVGLLAVTVMIFYTIGLESLFGTVERQHGQGGFNPLVNANLGVSYVLFQILGTTAATLTWQATISRLLAAKDADTGRKIYVRTSFFFVCRWIIPGMWGIAALTVMGWHPLDELSTSERSNLPTAIQLKIEDSPVGKPLAGLAPDELVQLSPDQQTRLGNASLHAMPKFLGTFLPIGVMGLLIAAMLAADMSTDSSYMLGWGSVIYNDILAPFRRKPWPDRRAILWNRCIVALIGVYLFVFGLLYELEGDVWSFILLTGSIYLSSISVLLVACCYWPRANNWGAIGSILLGAFVPIAHLAMQKIPATKELASSIGSDSAGIAAFVASALGMIIGSFLKPSTRETRSSELS